MTEAAAPYAIAKLRHLGWESADFRDLDDGGGVSFVGDSVRVTCSHRSEGGNTYEDWDLHMPRRVNESDSTVARSLNAKFSAIARQSATARPAALATPKAGEVDDAAIPF